MTDTDVQILKLAIFAVVLTLWLASVEFSLFSTLWANVKQRWIESLTDETMVEQMKKVWNAPVVKVRVKR
jgi:hypothetical protein